MASFEALLSLEKTIDDPTPSWSAVPFFCVLSPKKTISVTNLRNFPCFSYHIGGTCPVKEFFAATERCISWDRKEAATHIPPTKVFSVEESGHLRRRLASVKICAVHFPPCWHVAPSKLSLCPCAHCVCLPFANVRFPCATFRAPAVCHQLIRTVFSCVASHRFGRCFDAHGREDSQRAPENCSHDGWVLFESHHNRGDSTRASMSVTCNVYVLTRSKKTLSAETCVKNDASDHLAMAHGDAKTPEEKSPKRMWQRALCQPPRPLCADGLGTPSL